MYTFSSSPCLLQLYNMELAGKSSFCQLCNSACSFESLHCSCALSFSPGSPQLYPMELAGKSSFCQIMCNSPYCASSFESFHCSCVLSSSPGSLQLYNMELGSKSGFVKCVIVCTLYALLRAFTVVVLFPPHLVYCNFTTWN